MNTSQSTPPSDTPSVEEIESLLIGNEDFQDIETHLRRFNPIEVMGMSHMEIRHSAILGWLLDPSENHGLGDRILQAFLAKALSGEENPTTIKSLEILQSDYSTAEVRREWRNIDLAVIDPPSRTIFIIENKFHSKQRKGQLQKYYDDISSVFEAELRHEGNEKMPWRIQGIFLRLSDEQPEDTIQYACMSYASVLVILQQALKSEQEALRPKIATFIQHYVNSLKGSLDMDEETNKLRIAARKLYKQHKKTFDFIFEHGQGNEFLMACKTIFPNGFANDSEKWVFDEIGAEQYGFSEFTKTYGCFFLPKVWYDAFGKDKLWWDGCEKWGAGFPLLYSFQLFSSRKSYEFELRLFAEVGPLKVTDPLEKWQARDELIDAIQDVCCEAYVSFPEKTHKNRDKEISFLQPIESTRSIKDENNSEEIARHMRELLKKFESQIKKIAQRLTRDNFRKYGKEELVKDAKS